MDIRNSSMAGHSSGVIRRLHEAAVRTRSAKVLAALNESAWTIGQQAAQLQEGTDYGPTLLEKLADAGPLTEMA